MLSFCPVVFIPPPPVRFCRWLCAASILTVGLGFAGCSNSRSHAGNEAANRTGAADAGLAPQASAGNPVSAEHLGTVHVIGTGQRFVLVQTPSAQPVTGLADGQSLVCRAAAGNVTATLRVSPVRRPPFVVADVATGEPHVGDEVFIDPASGRTAVPEATPAAPEFRANPGLPPTR